MHYNAWEAEVGSPRRHSATKSRLFYAHSLVRPPAEPFPRPGRSTSAPARAANVNDGALAPPQGSSLTGASTTASSRRRGEEVATSSRPSFTPPASLAKCVLLLIARRTKEDYHGALADFNDAIKLAPDRPEGFFNRGLTYLVMRHADYALIDFN